MKLKKTFLVQSIDDTPYLVPVGKDAGAGLVRGNKTTGFLVELLKKETDEEALVDAMCRKYDAPREVIAADVREFLDTLRGIGAIEE